MKKEKKITHPAGESQKEADKRKISVGVNKRGGQSPK